MKLRKIILLTPLIALSSCVNENENTTDPLALSIIAPTGAPAIALSSFSDRNLETTTDPKLLKAYFASGNFSVIVAPTDVGVNSIKQGCDYKLAATITFGNFFLISTGTDTNTTLDKGDSIVLFQQGALPDKIFHYIYGTEFDSSITYVSNVSVAANAYQSKEVTTADGNKIVADYVLLSEPKITALNIESTKIVDLSANFIEKSKSTSIYQASVFVKNGINADSLLNTLKTDIENMITTPENVIKNMNKVNDPQTFFGMAPAIAKKCMEKGSLGINFSYAKEHNDSINNYLEILGMEDANEEVFY